jgi:signal transduction histidine kinase
VNSLRVQLILWTALPVVVMLVALAGVGMMGYRELTVRLVGSRDREIARLAAEKVQAVLAEDLDQLRRLADVPALRAGHSPQIRDELLIHEARLRFDRIAFINARGQVVATSSEPENLGGVADSEELRAILQADRPVRSDIVRYADGGAAGRVLLGVPVRRHDGSFGGTLTGEYVLPSAHLAAAIQTIEVDRWGNAVLVDGQGNVLYDHDESQIGRPSALLRELRPRLRHDMPAQVVRSPDGTRLIVGYHPISLVIPGSADDPSWEGWALLTRAPWDEAIAPLAPYLRVMGTFLVVAAGVPLLAILIGARRVSVPLNQLAERVRRIEAAQDSPPVHRTGGPRELRELSAAIEAMQSDIAESRAANRRYVAAMLRSQEEERARVARELHDDTAQRLIALVRRLDVLESRSSDEQVRSELRHLRDFADESLTELRRLLRDLRPPMLEEVGLLPALRALIDNDGSNSPIRLTIRGTQRPAPPQVELTVFRVAQEALNNVRKHAQASQVNIALTYQPKGIGLSVCDDGCGFELSNRASNPGKEGHIGLVGMYERVTLSGGRFSIDSSPGQGTTVEVWVPYDVGQPATRRPAGVRAAGAVGPETRRILPESP